MVMAVISTLSTRSKLKFLSTSYFLDHDSELIQTVYVVRFSFVILFLIHIRFTAWAETLNKELNLNLCKAGDFIVQHTHNGQGSDRLEIKRRSDSGVCEIEFMSELEGGYRKSICQISNKMKSINFSTLPKESCVDKKTGNAFEDMAQLRENGCGNFSVARCPSSRCSVMKACDGTLFCNELKSSDSFKCGGHGYYGQRVACCPGLKLSCPGMTVVPWSKTQKSYVVPSCLNCGNKICEPLEDSQNCPSDCK
jgi:hypothetical protein